jgi:hypothetical protein
MTDEKVVLSDRTQLLEIVKTRLSFMALSGEDLDMERVAALITDDILTSEWNVGRISRATSTGIDAGYEKGLREAIAVVGEMERTGAWEGGPFNLVEYEQTQRAVARLSKRGLESLWDEQMEQLEGEQK